MEFFHLVFDVGFRLQGAEAILKLRALRNNSDFEQYWTFHLNQELHRVHQARYADMTIPTAA